MAVITKPHISKGPKWWKVQYKWNQYNCSTSYKTLAKAMQMAAHVHRRRITGSE